MKMIPGAPLSFIFPVFLLLLPAISHAGFFDELKRQAEETVQGVTKGVVDGITPGRKEPPQQEETPPHSSTQDAQQTQTTISAQQRYSKTRTVQLGLKRLGYYKGTPDGKYGKQTRAAILAYQRDRGLAEDGQITDSLAKDIKYVRYNDKARAELARKQQVRASAARPASPTSAVPKYTGLPTFGRHTHELLKVRFNPEVYSLDYKKGYYLEKTLQRLYPNEWRAIGDEFEKRRQLPKLRERLLREARQLPLRYRFLKASQLSRYNFEAQQFQVGYPQLPVIADRFAGSLEIKMAPDAAEAFKKRCTGGSNYRQCEVYVEIIANVIGAGKGPDEGVFGTLEQIRIYNHSTNGDRPDAQLSDLVYEVDPGELFRNTNFERYGGAKILEESGKKDESKIEISF